MKLPASDEASKITPMASGTDQTPGPPDEEAGSAPPGKSQDEDLSREESAGSAPPGRGEEGNSAPPGKGEEGRSAPPDKGEEGSSARKGDISREGGLSDDGVAPEAEAPTPRGKRSWFQRRKERKEEREATGADADAARELPTSPSAPPEVKRTPPTGVEPIPRNKPSTGHAPGSRERPSTRDAPSPKDEPRTRDAQSSKDAPSSKDEPSPREASHPPSRAADKVPRRRVASMDDLADLSDSELSDLPEPPPSVLRRLPWWAYVLTLLFVVVVALVLYGEVNSQRYYLVCKAGAAEAHQGRGFPWPFGHSALGGPLYRPVPLHVEAQCEPQELDSEDQLQRSLLALLVAELERRRGVTKLGDLKEARRLLTQGFGLARGDKTWVERIQALQAHFDLQEGILRLRDVEIALVEIRRLMDRARKIRGAAKTGTLEDPEPWIALVDHLLERLRAGSAPKPREDLPVPVPVPIPSRDATAPAVTSGQGPATRPAPPFAPEEPPRPAIPVLPDAGVKGGGILL